MILSAAIPEPSLLANILIIIFAAAITDNILLTRFLGLCPFLSVSREMKSALGLGAAVVFVTCCTCGINAALYHHVLIPLDKIGVPATTLKLILFIVVIAGFVQFMEMFIERVSIKLYFSLGIFLPLITVNCAILGTSLFMVNKDYNVGESFAYGFGAGLGWFLAIVLMAGIRQRLKKAKIPAALEGAGIALIIAGIMAMAFVGLSGLIRS